MIRKILFIGNYPNAIDVNLNVFFQNLIYQIADMGIKCTVIAPVSITKYREKTCYLPYRHIEKTKQGNIITVFSPKYISYSAKKIGKIDTHIWTVKSLRKSVYHVVNKESIEFDATYGHFINIGGVPACKIAKDYGIPSFIANGESDLNPKTYHLGSNYDIDSIYNCSAVISVSTKNKEELISTGLVSANKIQVFPNAIDNSVFKKKNKKECRKNLGFPEDDFIVGFVGGFSNRKGDKRVARATENIGVKVAFCGSGKDKPQGDHIIFCDSVKHDCLVDYLNAFDVFVLPTLNEGCCNAIIEAMACGLPIISSDRSFNYDVLSPDNAILIDPLDVNEIKRAILKLKNDRILLENMSKASLMRASKLTISERAQNIVRYMNEHENRIN